MKFLVKKIKHKKNTGNWKKILEKSGKSQGILSARKSGNPDSIECIEYCTKDQSNVEDVEDR